MQSKLYNQEGKEVGEVTLPDKVFNVPRNDDLLHEVIVSMRSNARQNSAHTKDRREVRGGGKKPWRQKGTGRARHGSIRSPLWRGGGTTFGPLNERNYNKKINKKVRAKALAVVLSEKLRCGELIFLDAISLENIKTKQAKEIISRIRTIVDAPKVMGKEHNLLFILLPGNDDVVRKSFRNFSNIEVAYLKDLNPMDIMTYRYIIITRPETSISLLEKRIKK